MCSLDSFPTPPEDGLITVCELENSFVALAKADPAIPRLLEKVVQYPIVEFPGDLLKFQSSRESAKEAFLENKPRISFLVTAAWQERGFVGILEELSSSKIENTAAPWLQKLAQIGLGILRWSTSLCGSIFPHMMLSSEDLIDEFSSVVNWNNSVLRALAWHPIADKFALAICDDTVRIYSLKRPLLPTLKHSQQKGISDLAWQPYMASVLCVACQDCIVVWTIDPSSLITRPSADCAQILKYPGHNPVVSLSWNHWGNHLLSSSPASSSILAWTVSVEECEEIRRLRGSGVSLVLWSPNGALVFSATVSPLIRVFETKTWTCETWHQLDGRCQAACWSPDSSVLLFATKNDCIVYALHFVDAFDLAAQSVGGSKAAVPVINLKEVEFNTPQGAAKVGGCVHSMVWDPSGERLAILLGTAGKDVHSQRYIAVFRTRTKPMLEIVPCGFVAGHPEEVPQLISFHPHYSDGALLTVCWSHRYKGSGRVGFVPFHFVPTALAGITNTSAASGPFGLNTSVILRPREHASFHSNSFTSFS